MSKLSQIRKALRESLNVIIVGALEENSLSVLPGPHEEWGHKITFFIAPNRFIAPQRKVNYTVKNFYDSLMREFSFSDPELTPVGVTINPELDLFPYRGVKFGVMWFNEDIGTVTVYEKIVLREEDSFLLKDRLGTSFECARDIRRQVTIKFFLDIKTASKALEAENIHGITESQLERYQKPQNKEDLI